MHTHGIPVQHTFVCSALFKVCEKPAIIRSRIYFPNPSSWLRQHASRHSGEVSFFPRLCPASGRSPSVRKCQKAISISSSSSDESILVSDPSAGRRAHSRRLRIFNCVSGFLASPERSATHVFGQKRYATAAKECLELYLCRHFNLSKETTELSIILS